MNWKALFCKTCHFRGSQELEKSLTVCIQLFCLCFDNPLYIVLNGDSHRASFGDNDKKKSVRCYLRSQRHGELYTKLGSAVQLSQIPRTSASFRNDILGHFPLFFFFRAKWICRFRKPEFRDILLKNFVHGWLCISTRKTHVKGLVKIKNKAKHAAWWGAGGSELSCDSLLTAESMPSSADASVFTTKRLSLIRTWWDARLAVNQQGKGSERLEI